MENIIRQVLPIILFLGLMYFMLFLPEKKRKTAFQKMVSELKVNDEVTTRGGIIGKIIKLDEETITLETGADRVKIKFSKSAVATVRTGVQE